MNRLFATALLITLTGSASLDARAQNQGESIVVTAGTQARLTLQTPLSSKLSEVGDRVTALLDDDMTDADGRIAIPHGVEFRGRVTQVNPAGHMQKRASMTIVFETARLANHIEKISVVVTAVDDLEDDRKLKAKNRHGKVSGGRSGERTFRNASTGAATGLLGGVYAGVLRGRFPLTEAKIGLAGGVIGGILVTKGNDIKLPPGTILRIRFERPLTLQNIESERLDDDR